VAPLLALFFQTAIDHLETSVFWVVSDNYGVACSVLYGEFAYSHGTLRAYAMVLHFDSHDRGIPVWAIQLSLIEGVPLAGFYTPT
jgi:hypothetical protein